MRVGINLPFACLFTNISIVTAFVVGGAIAAFMNPSTSYLSQ